MTAVSPRNGRDSVFNYATNTSSSSSFLLQLEANILGATHSTLQKMRKLTCQQNNHIEIFLGFFTVLYFPKTFEVT